MSALQKKGHRKRSSALITIILMMVIGGGFLGIHIWEKNQSVPVETVPAAEETDEIPGRMTVSFEEKTYQLRDDLETYLIIGLDKFSTSLSDPEAYINNQQSDFLLLMVLDRTARSYCAVHINRDTMTEIMRLGVGGKQLGTFKGQLALAHTYGSGGRDSCRNTTEAVSGFLYGIPIDHYFSITMDAIPVLNDLMDGVTVHIDDDFSAIDPTMEQGKNIRLVGQQALYFIRARKDVGDQSNLSRMNRQREYMYALYQQLSEKLRTTDGFSARLASKLADYSVSDLTTTQLSNLSDLLKDYRFTTIYTIDGEAVKGENFMEFYADDTSLRKLVIQLFFKEVK